MMTWPVWAAMRPIDGDQAGLGAALDFVVRLVLADRVDQVVPLELVRVRLRLRERPGDVSSLSIFWPL